MNRIFKTVVLSFMVFVFVLSAPSVTAQAAETDNVTCNFGVSFETDGFEYRIDWHKRENVQQHIATFMPPSYVETSAGEDSDTDRFITLPYGLESRQLTVDCDGNMPFYLDGERVDNGQKITLGKGTHTVVCGNEQYSLTVYYTGDIPVIYIDTESGDMDYVYANKNNKASAMFTLVEEEKVVCSEELDYIKGRGNFSWDRLPKKSFSIKFIEDKPLLGMKAAKAFTLQANYIDMTLLKNSMVFELAENLGLQYTPQSQMTEVYINGEYMGCYALMEKVEVAQNRVDITPLQQLTQMVNKGKDITKSDLMGVRGEDAHKQFGTFKWTDIKSNPYNITGGYLLEVEMSERYDDAICGFVTEYGQAVTVSYPEYASKAQMEYISSYYQQMEQALISDNGYNSLGKHYSEYIDIESMAKMFLVQEFAKNLDAGLTSFYLYKNRDDIIKAGPVWDMDSGLGRPFERFGDNMADPENLWAANGRQVGDDIETNYTILALLWRHSDFRSEVIKQWNENMLPQMESFISGYRAEWSSLEQSIFTDRNRWTGAGLSEGQISDWCESSLEDVEEFAEKRAEYLTGVYNSEHCFITYSANGAPGVVTDGNLYLPGTSVKLKENWYKNGETAFIGWNTAADGSGEMYLPGDEITVNEDITLYAQWDKTAPQNEGGFIAKIISVIKRILG